LSQVKELFIPHPKQEEFISAVLSGNYSLLTYGGAMGGGKSYVCLACAILLARIYKKSKWVVIRESLPTLKLTSIPTFWKIAPTNYIKSFNQSEHIITFKNDSQIIFMAENYVQDKEFDRFKGLEVNGFVLEQIEELQKGLLDVCFIRAGRHAIDPMPPPMILANLNPTLMWPRKHIYDKWLANKLPKDWFYLSAKITDNPVLVNNERYMANLANLDDITKARLIEGDWDAFGIDKPYLYAFVKKKHVIENYEVNPHLQLLISFDFNKDPMTCLIGQMPHYKRLVIFDEIKIKDGSSPEICELILAKYPQFLFKMDVTGDASGRSRSALIRGNKNHYDLIKEKLDLQNQNLLVPDVNPGHLNSRIMCNSVMQNAEFAITSNCEETIKDLIYTEVNDEGDPKKTQSEGRHFFDNVRYLIEAAFPDFISKPYKYVD